MRIIGAGMAGLLAGAMLRDELEAIYEGQSALPNNHSAVLRFRTNSIGEVLNIPFKAVQVFKGVIGWRNPVADALMYSIKTNGKGQLRSILSAEERMVLRWIAPVDLVARMERKLQTPVQYNTEIVCSDLQVPTISTIPMPALMDMLDFPGKPQRFDHRPGSNIIVRLTSNIDAYCSLYVPEPNIAFSRLSLTGNELIAECYGDEDIDEMALQRAVEQAVEFIGLNANYVESFELRRQRYAKILPIDEGVRRNFIVWASETHNIYSLGRFATWRPGLLLDDLVNDVRVIQRLIDKTTGEAYNHKAR